MILKTQARCLAATHVPASEYVKKDGTKGTRAESWEVLLRYADLAYSRAKKDRIQLTTEELHESRVEMKVGIDYDLTVEARVLFGEPLLTITDAREIKVAK